MDRSRLHFSWAVLAAGALGGSLSEEGGLGAALFLGYLFWSVYWGGPPFWRWWRRSGIHGFGFLRYLLPCGCSWPLRLLLSLGLLGVGGYFYCLLGGGLFHFARYLVASRRAV